MWLLLATSITVKGDTGERNQLNPSVIHNDRFILFQSKETRGSSDYFDIWRMDLVSKERKKLTYSEYDEVRPKVNFNEDIILFSSFDPQNKSSLWLMNLNGSNPHKISPENFNCEHGVFHPLERKIMYCSDENNSPEKYNIWEMDYDGANRSLLINVEERPLVPSYSADGKQVVFNLQNDNDSYSIMHYDIHSGNMTEISSGKWLQNPNFYSNDKIFFIDFSYMIAYNLTTNHYERFKVETGVDSFCFNTAKNRIYYSSYKSERVLWMMNIDGSDQEQLVPSPTVGSGILEITWFDFFLVLLELLPFLLIIGFVVWYFRSRREDRSE